MTASPTPHTPSEAASLIVELIPTLPEEVGRDLRRLLAAKLTTTNRIILREQRLGLLMKLVAQDGEVPTVEAYTRARDEAAERGEEYASATTMAEAYCGWTRAVRAAVSLLPKPSKKHSVTSADNHHLRPQRSYTREEVVERVRECLATTGVAPHQLSAWMFDDYAMLTRAVARQAGKPVPRLPSYGA